MELSMLGMYWLVKLDDIRSFFGGASAIFAFVSIMGVIATLLFTEGEILKRTRLCISTVIISVLTLATLSAAVTFIPSTKQMAAIFVLPAIVNNEKVQDLPSKILDLSTAWLEELKPNTEDQTTDK